MLTVRIVSNRIGYFCIGWYIAAGSAAVNWLHYTGDQRAVATCHPLRANAIDRPRYSSSNAHCNTAAVNYLPYTCFTTHPSNNWADCRARRL